MAGVALGLLGAVAGAQLLRSFLYAVEPIDPATFLGAAVVIAVTAAACYLPARRAAAVDPIEALVAE